MPLTINTNLSSLIAQSSLKQSTFGLNQAIERMTTGFKINGAKDNAAGHSISTKMSTKIGAYQVAEDNVLQGMDLLSTAESSLNQIIDKVSRLKELAIQAANGTNGQSSAIALTLEAESLVSEVQREFLSTEYNGIKLFVSNMSNVDETKRVVNQTSFIAGETYYIKKSEDLVKLQNLVNSGIDTKDVTFELIDDIDMAGVNFRGIGVDETNSFKGTFDGLGHTISNLTINTTEDNVGLFGYIVNAEIKSLGVLDCNITGGSSTGGIVGITSSSSVNDAKCIGSIKGKDNVGGVVACVRSSKLLNSYFSGDVYGTSSVGGFAGRTQFGSYIETCFSDADVVSDSSAAGFISSNFDGTRLKDCFSLSNVSGSSVAGFIAVMHGGTINCAYNKDSSDIAILNNPPASLVDALSVSEIKSKYTDVYVNNGWKVVDGELRLAWEKDSLDILAGQHEITLQVASGSEAHARIGFDISFDLSALEDVLANGLSSSDTLILINSMLDMLTQKASEYGAIQNRLMSVLDEISIKYENLVSSRSTLRDSDISKESSAYIRNQILQQASATLLATANQSPAIALQFIYDFKP